MQLERWRRWRWRRAQHCVVRQIVSQQGLACRFNMDSTARAGERGRKRSSAVGRPSDHWRRRGGAADGPNVPRDLGRVSPADREQTPERAAALPSIADAPCAGSTIWRELISLLPLLRVRRGSHYDWSSTNERGLGRAVWRRTRRVSVEGDAGPYRCGADGNFDAVLFTPPEKL